MKKKVLFLFLGFCLIGFSQDKEFVKGLKRSNVYTFPQISEGIKYLYGDNTEVFGNASQIAGHIEFKVNNKKRESYYLNTEFDVGYIEEDEEISSLRNDVIFQIGEYDFDQDGATELIIAIQEIENDSGITINVFKNTNGKFKNIAKLTGVGILGIPMAEIKGKEITINKNIRGFFHKWVYVKGRFIDKSNM